MSPLRTDVMDELQADWLAQRLSTEFALMLAWARVLIQQDLYDRIFLATFTVESERFAADVRGKTDGRVELWGQIWFYIIIFKTQFLQLSGAYSTPC